MPRITRNDVIAAIPTVRQAVEGLRSRGAARQADAVETVLSYAVAAVEVREHAAQRETVLDQSLSLYITTSLRDRLRDRKANVTVDVREGLQAFLDGTWTPPRPQRAPHGSTPPKISTSVRVPQELWERVDELAKDPEAAAERGYRLNARQVAIGWLERKYPAPAAESAGQ